MTARPSDHTGAQAMSKPNTVRLTIFLRHDQTKNLEQIDEILFRQGFWAKFPPAGAEIISWQVMMGIGQVVTLEVEADKVRAVNLAIETMAWGALRTFSSCNRPLQPSEQVAGGLR